MKSKEMPTVESADIESVTQGVYGGHFALIRLNEESQERFGGVEQVACSIDSKQVSESKTKDRIKDFLEKFRSD